ncbi:DNA-binding transcriptional regulator, CsgD family [Bradyrhizobium lablabi]|uniref:DNA-binding transcriptional regulator, CsgD family n=1 Tax=Bradyrhizobium lablabi TaxID=722472 RepID=A0A1M6RPL4_9BRAD|nr:helix-turn-helix transcriptional regulator [Bradyrhizobium lablabi]SHK34383.1 DNA-binding transcriptional regulator, CsgD family [Bradyrhizobium lablabi]
MASVDFDRLNAISSRLGEAVIDPGLWPSLMVEICRAANTTGAALLQSDMRTPDIPMTGSAQEIFQSYFKNNLHINDVRAVRGTPLLLAGSPVVTDQDIFKSEREMLLDPLYADLDNYGFRWWAAVGFMSGSALWGLSLQRTKQEGQFEAPELAALSQLSRRLSETATLSKAVGRLVLSGMTNALHLVRQPALALDRRGFVIDVNSSADKVFDEEIRIRNRRLFVLDQSAKAALTNLISQLRNTPDTAAIEAAPIVVRRKAKQPVVIRILPVDGAARSPFLGARAILILDDLSIRQRVEKNVVLSAFGLTPTEAQLAIRIAGGLSLDQVAEELNMSRETSRNHLKAIFAKTGTHRQGELVALLSRL